MMQVVYHKIRNLEFTILKYLVIWLCGNVNVISYILKVLVRVSESTCMVGSKNIRA